jgi:GT2 family glycosyltransferase
VKHSLIICTYQRPKAICTLLDSVLIQTKIPDEILIIDASLDSATELAIKDRNYYIPLNYILVDKEYRGLTRQRNYGVSKVSSDTEIVSFLDDDVTLEPGYFGEIEMTFRSYPNAIGVGGLDLKNNSYFKNDTKKKYSKFSYYAIDGWTMKEPLRNKTRKLFGLMPRLQPGLIPEYSNGRSTLPPNGRTYEVEHLIGMSMSFKREIFRYIGFSSFFEGYGLYEDFDFCVRALKFGKLYVNTNAKVWHYHEPSGRPDFYKYGKMVVRNGWYVWRVRYQSPSVKSRIKWHATTLLLAALRLMNVITGPNKKGVVMDFIGRTTAWFGVLVNPPGNPNNSCS